MAVERTTELQQSEYRDTCQAFTLRCTLRAEDEDEEQTAGPGYAEARKVVSGRERIMNKARDNVDHASDVANR